MTKDSLSTNERKILQYLTIIGIIVLIYLFFVKQQAITAMIVGVILVLAQKFYLRLKK